MGGTFWRRSGNYTGGLGDLKLCISVPHAELGMLLSLSQLLILCFLFKEITLCEWMQGQNNSSFRFCVSFLYGFFSLLPIAIATVIFNCVPLQKAFHAWKMKMPGTVGSCKTDKNWFQWLIIWFRNSESRTKSINLSLFGF